MKKQFLRRHPIRTLAICLAFGSSLIATPKSFAQAVFSTEQYQELFASAGYSTLFGAALGTAVLPFIPNNSVSNLRVIAGGASIGFVTGSILALYNMRQRSQYGMQYYPEPIAEENEWQWDLGSSNGRDMFVKMGSRF